MQSTPVPPPRSPWPGALAVATLLAACVGGCATTPPPEPTEPQAVHPDAEEVPIGFFLARLGTAIERWKFLKLEGATSSDAHRVQLLAQRVRLDTRLRLGEVIVELESGPPTNRAVAAMALGFTGMEEAQSPLLSALDDPDPVVVGNALLGIGMLAMPDTPLAQICYLLRRDPDPVNRNNAARAILYVLDAGGQDECAAESARAAVLDSTPGVRSYAALILALTDDAGSIDLLAGLLHDAVPLVCHAAARSLAHLGRRADEHAGDAARALVTALDRVPSSNRGVLLTQLVRLSGENFGDETEPWRDWAYRLP